MIIIVFIKWPESPCCINREVGGGGGIDKNVNKSEKCPHKNLKEKNGEKGQRVREFGDKLYMIIEGRRI